MKTNERNCLKVKVNVREQMKVMAVIVVGWDGDAKGKMTYRCSKIKSAPEHTDFLHRRRKIKIRERERERN